LSDPLSRALHEIRERQEQVASEVVVRRAEPGKKCGWPSCWRRDDVRFEVRGEVKIYACGSHIDDALHFVLAPEKPDDDLAMHVGRHSSVVTNEECVARHTRPEGTLPKPIGRSCYVCDNTPGKKLRCVEVGCKTYTHCRCSCGAAVCSKCFPLHELRDYAGENFRTIWNARGLVYHNAKIKGHSFARRGMP
jgi:hypothetical protein